MKNVHISGGATLAMKLAVQLARANDPEFKGMTDSEVLSKLVERGLDQWKEETA